MSDYANDVVEDKWYMAPIYSYSRIVILVSRRRGRYRKSTQMNRSIKVDKLIGWYGITVYVAS